MNSAKKQQLNEYNYVEGRFYSCWPVYSFVKWQRVCQVEMHACIAASFSLYVEWKGVSPSSRMEDSRVEGRVTEK